MHRHVNVCAIGQDKLTAALALHQQCRHAAQAGAELVEWTRTSAVMRAPLAFEAEAASGATTGLSLSRLSDSTLGVTVSRRAPALQAPPALTFSAERAPF